MQLFIRHLLNASYVPVIMLGTVEDTKMSKNSSCPRGAHSTGEGWAAEGAEREEKKTNMDANILLRTFL